MAADCDVLVVGGGINGAAIARDAAGRGARVVLAEKDDLAGHTSSASTKLIHGGLRYLEQFEFRMVGEALAERERMMHAAPHLVRPLRFVLPYDRAMRPRWMVRIGLLLYDWLGGRSSLPRSHAVRLDRSPYGSGLQSRYRHGFVYSDCWGDDARLVIANAQDAARKGAIVLPRTAVVEAKRRQRHWDVGLRDPDGGRRRLTARVLVNAAGAWATEFLADRAGVQGDAGLRLVKGSHIVTRRLYHGEHAYILQNSDRRIVFAIPYERDFTLIGTTDVEWGGRPDHPALETGEVEYLCDAVNRWLRQPISSDDILWSYSGLRALFDDASGNPSEISRDYVLAVDRADDSAPVLSVYGGKITTHRVLAEDAVDKLSHDLAGLGPAWTSGAKLPGGNLGAQGLAGLGDELQRRAPFLARETVSRLAASYGDAALDLLDGVHEAADLGERFGAGLTEVEVEYLRSHEWARTADDIVWRRSKLGLHMTPCEVARLEEWLSANRRDADDEFETPWSALG